VIPYTAADGSGPASGAMIMITVDSAPAPPPDNAPPVAVDDSASTPEDTPVTLNLLGNDSDPEADPLTITRLNGQAVVPGSAIALSDTDGTAAGVLTLNPDGTVSFVPALNFHGAVDFSYTIADGQGGTATANAHIDVTPVDDPSVLAPDTNTVAEDTPATGNLLTNDSDVDNTLTVASFTVGVTTVAAGQTTTIAGVGTLTVAANGDYVFTPDANWNGTVPTVTYTTNTGSSSTLDITVTPVDDASVLAPDTNTVAEDTPATGNVLTNDSDVDNALSVTSFTVAGTTVAAGQTTTIAGVGTITVAANGDYVFTPEANWNGSIPTVTYTTNTGSSATLDITVTPVPDAPEGQDNLRTTQEDVAYVVRVADFGYSDPDGDALAAVRIDTLPGHGVLTLNGVLVAAGQTISMADINSGLLVFSPAPNASGSPYDDFSFSVQDATGLFDGTPNVLTLNVIAVADAPTLDITVKAYSASSDFEEVDFPGYGKILVTDLHGGVWRTDNNGGTVEVGDAATYLNNGSTNQVIELEQDPRDRSNLYTTVAVEAGEVYALSFDFAARQTNGAQTNSQIFVYWEGQLVQVLNSSSGTLTHFSMDLIATSSGDSKLEFIAGDSNSYGGVLDNLSLSLQQNTGYQGYLVNLPDIAASLTDLDNSESLAVRITAIPLGATLTDGIHSFTASAGSTTAEVSTWDLTHLALVPPDGLVGPVSLQVSATSTEASNGDSNTVTTQIDLNILPDSQGLIGSAGDDTLVGTAGDDRLWGLTGNDIIQAGDGNDIVLGGQGNDTLRGEAGNDTLEGGLGDDLLVGGAGQDVLSGGHGNDTLTGGTGSGDDGATDTFRWALGDGGSGGAPAIDTITDFSAAAVSNNGDVLDLRDLLQGELKATNNGAGTLQNYLDFDTTTSSGQTIIHVSTTGQFAGGQYDPAAEDQRIVLANLDLRSALGLAPNASDNLVIQELLTRGKLITDGP
jgi:VCBS repeat-containing protein